MLEQAALRLLPWTWIASRQPVAGEFSGWARWIQAENAGSLLGCVRKLRKFSRFNIGPRRLEVCETEDAALLMSLEQIWFSWGRWRVLDAERSHIGSVIGSHLLDEKGACFAAVWQESPVAKSIRRKDGAFLVRLEKTDDGTSIVRFAADLEANPFLRMVLLSACILQQPGPPCSPRN
jgi:hypothetical protein